MADYRVQVDGIVRDATPEEVSRFKATKAEADRLEAERQEQITARETALAKLAALGLSEAEIRALVG